MELISKYITYKQAIASVTASRLKIDNTPNQVQLENIIYLCKNALDAIIEAFPKGIYFHTIYRCETLNKAIKGAKNSQHMANDGAAADFDCDTIGKYSNLDLLNWIIDNLEFDQLIAEDVQNGQIEWIHLSLKQNNNRKQILIMTKVNGKTKYLPYETNKHLLYE